MKWYRLFSHLPIRSKLLYGYISTFLVIILLGTTVLYGIVRHTIQDNIENELEISTTGILNMVKTGVDMAVRSHLRGVAEAGLEIVRHHYGRYQAGAVSEEEAKAEAARGLLSLTIGQTGYVYCIDSTGVLRVHPEESLVGEDISEFDFATQQKRQRTGYVEYDWANPGEEEARPKALYMTYFGPWDWIISASSYREEFREFISVGDFRERVLSITFGKTGYPYIIDSKGNLIIHPKLEGTNIFDSVDSAGRRFIREVCELKRGRIVYPWRNPGEPKPREKLVIFNYIPELDWIVASSSYTEEFYSPLKTLSYAVLATVALMFVLVIPVTWRLSNSITRPLHAIIRRFAQGARGDLSARLDTDQGGEIGQLAEYYNTFMEQITASQRRLMESEENYRTLFENAADGVFRADADGVLLSVNPALAAMLDEPSPQALMRNRIAKGACLLAGEGGGPDILAMLAEREEVRDVELRLAWREGEELWISVNARAVRDRRGALVQVEGNASDITARKRVESEQRKAQAELERRVEERTAELSSWVYELERRNTEGALLREMGAMLQVCRQEEEAIPIVERYLRRLFESDMVTLYTQDPQDRALFQRVVATGECSFGRPLLLTRDDCWALRQGKPHWLRDLNEGVRCPHLAEDPCLEAGLGFLCVPLVAQEELVGLLYIAFGEPADARETANEEALAIAREHRQRLAVTLAEHLSLALSNLRLRETLRIQSIQDSLTGLFNRRYLEETMARELSRLQRHGTSVGVIMADLDHFKQVNDAHGHEGGDAILRAFGHALRTRTRGEDIACRYGGEEFVVVLMDANAEDAHAKAEELCDAVRDIAVLHDGKELKFTVSMGVAACPENGASFEEALQAADAALYRAKQRGRNRVAM